MGFSTLGTAKQKKTRQNTKETEKTTFEGCTLWHREKPYGIGKKTHRKPMVQEKHPWYICNEIIRMFLANNQLSSIPA